MIVRSDRYPKDFPKWLTDMAPFAWLCYNPSANIKKMGIKYDKEPKESLILERHHHLVHLEMEPFKYLLKSKDDWILYGCQPVYFIVHTVFYNDRWHQPIRHAAIKRDDPPFWITEDIEEAIECIRNIASCPNCCPKGKVWPNATAAVPVEDIAQYFIDLAWDERIVKEVILHKDQDWSKQSDFFKE